MTKQSSNLIKKITGLFTIMCLIPLAGSVTATSMSEIRDMEGHLISAGNILRA